jgi:hypothetical protein
MRLTPIAAAAALAILAAPSARPAPATPAAAVDVRRCGAKGDGKADDAPAFLAAIARATAQKVPVTVPMGIYRLGKPLVLGSVALCGPPGGAWNADIDSMPVLEPSHRDKPCVTMGAGAGLKGLCIRYKWQAEPTSGPAAVLVTGIGAYISGVKIMYPWDGIITDGVNNVGRLHIENVFMVSPRNVGVRVTGTWDVPSLRNVEVWNAGPVPRGLDKGIGFDLGKNDLIRLTDCFAFAMQTGFLLRDKIPGCKIEGGTWGTMANCATDYCGYGLVVEGDNTVSVSGGTFWNHAEGLVVRGSTARVRIAAAEFRSNGAPAVKVLSADHVALLGCSILRPMKEHKPPTVLLEGGRTILSGNRIDGWGVGIAVNGPAALTATGNDLEAHGFALLEDRHTVGGSVRTDIPAKEARP